MKKYSSPKMEMMALGLVDVLTLSATSKGDGDDWNVSEAMARLSKVTQ